MANEYTQSEAPLTDLDVQEAVLSALHRMDMARETDQPLVVAVEDGVVTLSGVVLTRIIHHAVLQTAATVPGVKRVIDNLYVDLDLEVAVSQALAMNPDTQSFQHEVSVSSYRGEIMLSGKLPSAEAVQAASAVAASVPGALSVVDRLTVAES